jgi:murein DD-endopeptidase MepM/ murein hydrolase activator NlpD
MTTMRAARRTRRSLRALLFLTFALAAVGIACRRDDDAAAPGIEPGADSAAVPAATPDESPRTATLPLPTNGEQAAPPTDRLLLPVQGVTAGQLRDTFNDARSSGRVHDAIDIMAPAGTPVLAVANGRVEKLFESERGGTTLYQFNPERTRAYYYAHLQGYAPGIAEQQPLRRGQVIGYVGSTGNASADAPHLHFAVFQLGPEQHWWEGTALNPYPLLRGTR